MIGVRFSEAAARGGGEGARRCIRHRDKNSIGTKSSFHLLVPAAIPLRVSQATVHLNTVRTLRMYGAILLFYIRFHGVICEQ